MATSLASDFKINDPVLQAGYLEQLAQATEAFNAASAGTIVMESPAAKTGHYEREAFFQALANGAVSRRDITSVAAATASKLTQAEMVRVKLNRKAGPTEVTLDALRKIGSSVDVVSFQIGQQVAKGVLVESLNTAIAAAAAAAQNASLSHDASAGTNITHTNLVDGLNLFGDRAQQIACWVMHSKVYHDLMKQGIADKVVEVAGVIIATGTVATLGRPTIITDSPSLIVSGTPDNYLTMGLQRNAVSLQITEEMSLVNQLITGNEQLIQRFQGEYAYNLGLMGYAWDVANGGANPAAAAVATGTNWDKVAASIKDTAGFVVKTK